MASRSLIPTGDTGWKGTGNGDVMGMEVQVDRVECICKEAVGWERHMEETTLGGDMR